MTDTERGSTSPMADKPKNPPKPVKVSAPPTAPAPRPALSSLASPTSDDDVAKAAAAAAEAARTAAAAALLAAEANDPSEAPNNDGIPAEAENRGAADPNIGPGLRGHVRVPMGSQVQKLALPERPGFHRHWFNDKPGRIQLALQAGYTHIRDSQGRPIGRVVGTRELGGGLQAYAMEIPMEWHLEYQAMKQDRLDEEDRAIMTGRFKEQPGDERRLASTPIRIRSVSGSRPI